LELQRAELLRQGRGAVQITERHEDEAETARRPTLPAEALEAINRDLENFIGTVTHDLRSPLRAVVGTSQILLDEHAGGLPDEACDLLRRQVAAGLKMSSLIDDLVEYTKLGQGSMERFEFDLSRMAQDFSYQLAERQWPSDCQFEITPAMRIQAVPALVRVVLQELMENAVKFSVPTGPVTVQVGRLTGPSESIYYVRDDGPGFEQETAAEYFEPFVRNCPPDTPGNGIGLAIVRKAITRHGGRVWAESSPGGGATFFFTFGSTA
jgi:signal transduction histidine kinase